MNDVFGYLPSARCWARGGPRGFSAKALTLVAKVRELAQVGELFRDQTVA